MLLLAGCDQSVPVEAESANQKAPVTLEQRANAALTAALADGIVTIDERLAEIARDVPGFGGFYFDASGTLNLYLKEDHRATEALAAVKSLLGDQRIAQATGQRVLQAQYDFTQLQGWRLLMRSHIPGMEGVTSLGIDETKNRLSVGVQNASAKERVARKMSELAIPRDAVLVEEVEPVRFLDARATPSNAPSVWPTHLDHKVRPLKGGLKIEWNGSACTLGFTAQLTNPPGGGTKTGFITNSHCTPNRGVVDGTDYYQNTDGDPDEYIGDELFDPAYCCDGLAPQPMLPPPPSDGVFRYSDAAFIKYLDLDASDVQFGRLARTEWRGTTSDGSVTLDGTFDITAEDTSPYQQTGDDVNKIGWASGWTHGDVSKTCEDVHVYDGFGNYTGYTYYCQTRVNADSDKGDSGSPVFTWDGSGDSVTLVGILWGGNNLPQFIYSPLNQVEQEIGPMETVF